MDTYFIDLDYQRAIEQADTLEQIAGSLKGIADEDMSKLTKNLKQAWEGENADSYLAKVGILQSNVSKTSAKLTEVAQTIRQMADNIRDAEIANQQLAQTRTYGG